MRLSFISPIFEFYLLKNIKACYGFNIQNNKLIAKIQESNNFNRIESNKFINLASKNQYNTTQTITSIILPGFGIKPQLYETLCENIQKELYNKNIASNIYIAKFTGNILHNLEAEDIVKKILKNKKYNEENTFIIGHSQGAYNAIDISQKYNTSLIQLAGTFNSKLTFPFPIKSLSNYNYMLPILVLLFERDEYVYCSDTVLDCADLINFGNNRRIVITIPFLSHLSGIEEKYENIYKNVKLTPEHMKNTKILYSNIISKKISTFIHYISTDSIESYNKISKEVGDTSFKFSNFIYEASVPALNIGQWSEDKQRSMIGIIDNESYKINSINHSIPSNIMYSLIYTAFPNLRFMIDLNMLLPSFVFNHPELHITKTKDKNLKGEYLINKNINIHVYNPLKNPINTFSKSITTRENWVKLKTINNNLKIDAQILNQNTFNEAFYTLSEDERNIYILTGKKMVFESDILIPLVPGCSLIWILTPLYINLKEDKIVIKSPVLRTNHGDGTYDSRFNAKLISIAQVLEWVLVKAFL
jgi:hypothetical protein